MIDLGPPPFIFAKPAIIRPATADLLRYGGPTLAVMPGMPGAGMSGVMGAVGSKKFPIIEATNNSSQETGAANHTIALPAGIQSGDLLLIYFGTFLDDAGRNNFNAPSGFTQISNFANGWRQIWWRKVATGGEGSTVTASRTDGGNSSGSTHASYRISNYIGTPEAAAGATGTSSTPNPPNLTPSWGEKSSLWLTGVIKGGLTAPPSNYQEVETGGAGAYSTAWRSLRAASENPGTWSASGSSVWSASTLAVQGTG